MSCLTCINCFSFTLIGHTAPSAPHITLRQRQFCAGLRSSEVLLTCPESTHCALFGATAAKQTSENQLFAHSFPSQRGTGSCFPFWNSRLVRRKQSWLALCIP